MWEAVTTEKGVVSNRDLCDLVKPFLSNKGGLSGNNITLVKEGKMITDDHALTKIFNDHYVNIVEKQMLRNQAVWLN